MFRESGPPGTEAESGGGGFAMVEREVWHRDRFWRGLWRGRVIQAIKVAQVNRVLTGNAGNLKTSAVENGRGEGESKGFVKWCE